MKATMWRIGLLAWLAPLLLVVLAGCGKEVPKAKQANTGPTPVAEKKGDDHSGWWCDEHSVPEEICGQCNAKYATEYKKKGDWCEKHDRPDSQCFICHPELREKFAAIYRGKYGKEPPPVQEEDKDKKEEKEKPGAPQALTRGSRMGR
jgi:hypothetical protein